MLKTHCDHQADGLVIIHPNWRDQPPAILKGWVDRVPGRGGLAEPGIEFCVIHHDPSLFTGSRDRERHRPCKAAISPPVSMSLFFRAVCRVFPEPS
ncbi:MAG: NAD(P)H-dependent oxidoreductase [Desulfobacterium sp.]